MMENRTVLFVDDEKNVLTSLKRLLHKEPYQSLFAPSGQEALELMEKEKVHVIVSDLRMPDMTGHTLFKKVRDRYPDVVRLILSAAADKDTVLNTIGGGLVYRYIIKPWNEKSIKEIIRHAIKMFDLLEEKRDLERRIEEHNRPIKN